MADAKLVAAELQARYEPLRAVTLVARLLMKALFADQSKDVVFWALVHAHYRGDDLFDGTTDHDFSDLCHFIVEDQEIN